MHSQDNDSGLNLYAGPSETPFRFLADLPERVHGVSIVTPPQVTEAVVVQAGELGIKHLWLQPGAESPAAIRTAEQLGMQVIAGGPCVLVALRFAE